jgi:hypothetical protein
MPAPVHTRSLAIAPLTQTNMSSSSLDMLKCSVTIVKGTALEPKGMSDSDEAYCFLCVLVAISVGSLFPTILSRLFFTQKALLKSSRMISMIDFAA